MIVNTASESLFDWQVPDEGVPWEEFKEKMQQQWHDDQEPANDGWTDSSGAAWHRGSDSDTWPLHQEWYERQRELAEAAGEPAFPEHMTRAWTDAQPMDGEPYGIAIPPPLATIREGLEWMRHDDADPDRFAHFGVPEPEESLQGPAQPELEFRAGDEEHAAVPLAVPAAAPAPGGIQIDDQAMIRALRDLEPEETPMR